MRYLESKNIVHRDLALRNLLATEGNKIKVHCDYNQYRPSQTDLYYLFYREYPLVTHTAIAALCSKLL